MTKTSNTEKLSDSKLATSLTYLVLHLLLGSILKAEYRSILYEWI